MDGAARVERRRSLKERLGLNGISCCGVHWGFGPISVLDDNEESPPQGPTLSPPPTAAASGCAAAGMNLAAALAAEREFRAGQESGSSPVGPETGRPNSARISLMRLLLHETEFEDLEKENKEKIIGGGLGNDSVCCVCMGRKKGAAFIPCGHTFCRVCSRELWLNRGSCPLCNRQIVEILHIF